MYRIIKGTPLTLTLSSRNTKRNPLKYYDPVKKISRSLRYASNQSSPFEDEQKGDIIAEPIVFEKGMLFVPKENPSLQHFLSIHPKNGQLFEEVDNERDASQDLVMLDLEDEAIELSRNMDVDMMELVCRVGLNLKVEDLSSAEIKRDARRFARKDPEGFLDIVNDPQIKLYGTVAKCIDQRILLIRNKNREVYFNTKENKSRMMVLPFGEDPIQTIASYLQTDEGIPVLRMLEKHLD